jgi:Domain of unknown function (DUF5076)
MPSQVHSLPTPPGLDGDPHAFEMARIWAAHGSQVVVLSVDANMDPAGWGLMLVDLGRHAARAYAQTRRYGERDAFTRILEGFQLELANPTDLGRGSCQ